MTCLPCLHPRRMDELYRSSTLFRNCQFISPAAIRKTVQLPWSRSYRGYRLRQSSSSAPTLPCQAFNFYRVRTHPIRQQSSNIPDTIARQGWLAALGTPTLSSVQPFRGRERSTWKQCLPMRYRNKGDCALIAPFHPFIALRCSAAECAGLGFCAIRVIRCS